MYSLKMFQCQLRAAPHWFEELWNPGFMFFKVLHICLSFVDVDVLPQSDFLRKVWSPAQFPFQ